MPLEIAGALTRSHRLTKFVAQFVGLLRKEPQPHEVRGEKEKKGKQRLRCTVGYCTPVAAHPYDATVSDALGHGTVAKQRDTRIKQDKKEYRLGIESTDKLQHQMFCSRGGKGAFFFFSFFLLNTSGIV